MIIFIGNLSEQKGIIQIMTYNAEKSVGSREISLHKTLDHYITPPQAWEALLALPEFTNGVSSIWDPACGYGGGPEIFEKHGYTPYASDIQDWGYNKFDEEKDFLEYNPSNVPPLENLAIATNPPYYMATEFIQHSLALLSIKRHAYLLRIQFLESKKRKPILDELHAKYVFPFISRLPRMHRAEYDGPKTGSSICFAWFIWEAPYDQDTIVRRI